MANISPDQARIQLLVQEISNQAAYYSERVCEEVLEKLVLKTDLDRLTSENEELKRRLSELDDTGDAQLPESPVVIQQSEPAIVLPDEPEGDSDGD